MGELKFLVWGTEQVMDAEGTGLKERLMMRVIFIEHFQCFRYYLIKRDSLIEYSQ